MNKNHLCFFFWVQLLINAQCFAIGSDIVYDPWNEAHNIATAANTAQILQSEAKELQYQIKNFQSLSHYSWQDIASLIQQLDDVSRQGQALSYAMADLDTQFRKRYPDYENSYGQNDFTTQYHSWSATTLDTLRSSLDALAGNAHDFQNEQSLLQQLHAQSETAEGSKQVLQVGNELASENVNQLEELKRIVAAQTNAQNAYMAYHVSKESYSEKNLETMNSNIETRFPNYHNNPIFGKISGM